MDISNLIIFLSIPLFIIVTIATFLYFQNKKAVDKNCIEKINLINHIHKLDKKYSDILYCTYNVIGSNILIDKNEIFDDESLFKLNEAKNIFYEVKKNKKLIKSNYVLLKIYRKIIYYDIDKSQIDNTIIYLILLVLKKMNC